MFITDQHRGRIREHLQAMQAQFDVLQALKPTTKEEFLASPVLRAAGERGLHILVETFTDIGNILIDALIMRDPASYEDILDIMTDEKVIAPDFAAHFLGAVRYRKQLAHDYLKIQGEDVWQLVQNHADDFTALRDFFTAYAKL